MHAVIDENCKSDTLFAQIRIIDNCIIFSGLGPGPSLLKSLKCLSLKSKEKELTL